MKPFGWNQDVEEWMWEASAMSGPLAESPIPVSECLSTTLHNSTDLVPNRLFLKGAGLLDDTLPFIEGEGVNHLRITVDDNIGVVGHHDDLAPKLVLPDLSNDQVVDQMVVQVVLWLVEDQGILSMRQQEDQHRGGSLAGRGLRNWLKVLAIPRSAIPDGKSILRESSQEVVEQLRQKASLPFWVVVQVPTKFALPRPCCL